MPTPFYHLSIAREILEHPALDPDLHQVLSASLGAFLLGNTAPDVQVISGQKRSATHFFSVPISPGTQTPWKRLLDELQTEGKPTDFDSQKAAYIAGYLCHLQADWFWVRDIFEPVFGPFQEWDSFSHRLYLHNVLRSYLDDKVIHTMPSGIEAALRKTNPRSWLHFIEDKFLIEWRDYLCSQLQSREQIRTIEVFASRHGTDPAAFQEMINSEERMDEEIFARISRQQLDEYRVDLVSRNIVLLTGYLDEKTEINHRRLSSFHSNERSGT